MSSTPRTRRLGRYSLVRELGRGTFGSVYLGMPDGSSHPVAVKVLRDGVDTENVTRFCLEGEIGQRLKHPGIVSIFEMGHDRGVHYYAMEYCPGATLNDRLTSEGQLQPSEAIRIVRTLAEVMAFAHDAGVIHRDLKPANVVFDEGERPRILDFGLARDRDYVRSLTQSGDILGTPVYMAPEQLRGERGIDHRVDVYALGGILYRCLTGRVPHRGRNFYEVSERVLHAAPAPIRGVSPRLEQACLKALAKAPGDRFADCRELAAELAECGGADHQPTTPRAPGAPWKLALAIGLPLAGLVGFALALSSSADAPPAPPRPEVATPAPATPTPASKVQPPAPTETGPDADELLSRALTAARAGEAYPVVKGLLEDARRASPPELEERVALHLAWHHYRRGSYEDALLPLPRLQASPRAETRAGAWFLQMRVLLQKGNPQDGLVCLRRVEEDPDAPEPLRKLAGAERAGWDLLARRRSDPRDLERLLADFERRSQGAILADDSGLALCVYVQLRMRLIQLIGRPSAADITRLCELARKAADRLHDDIHPYRLLALLSWHRYSLAGDRQGLEDKVSAMDHILGLVASPTVDALMWRGHTLYLLGRFADADRDVDEALRVDPGDIEALLWKGATLHGIGERAAARDRWRALFEARSEEAQMVLQRGGLRVELESIRPLIEEALR